MEVSVRSIIFIIGFLISLFFVIFPFEITIRKHKILINYATIPIIIAVILTISTCIPIEVFIRGILGRYSPSWAIDPTSTSSLVPLTVIILFLSLAYVCLSADDTGLFKYIATKFAKVSIKAKNPDIIGLTCFYLFAGIFTLTTSNDIVVLTLTPVILEFISKTQSKSLLPLLLAQFASANSFSAGLLSGNPSNFILTSVFAIDFITYLKYLLLPSVVSGLVVYVYSYILCKIILHKKSKLEVHPVTSSVSNSSIDTTVNIKNDSISIFNTNEADLKTTKDISIPSANNQSTMMNTTSVDQSPIKDEKISIDMETKSSPLFETKVLSLNAKVSAVILIFMFIMFLVSSSIQTVLPSFEFWYIAVLMLVITLIKDIIFSFFDKNLSIWRIVKAMPWKVPLFLFAMFILVEASAYYGLIYDIASIIQKNIVTYLVDNHLTFILLFFFIILTCIACCIFNNLPATIVMSRILNEPLLFNALGNNASLVMYAIAAGTNFGACIMPHCSLAGLMWSSMIENKKVLKKVWKHGSVLCLLMCIVCISMQMLQSLYY